MRHQQPSKPKLSVEEAKTIQGYQAAAKSQSFMATVRSVYRASRKRSMEGFEKNDGTAAYWTGRADALEAIIDNCQQSESIDLSKLLTE